MSSPDEVTDTSVKLYWGASAERDEVSFYSVEIFTLENRQVCQSLTPIRAWLSSMYLFANEGSLDEDSSLDRAGAASQGGQTAGQMTD